MSIAQTAAQMTGRPYNNKVAILTDSRGAVNSSPTSFSNRGFLTWARMLTGQRARFDHSLNFGVNGDTSEQVLARTDAALAATDAAIFVILCGTNDGAWPGTFPGQTSAQRSIAAYTGIRDRVLAQGRICLFVAETPRGDTAFPALVRAANSRGAMQQMRQWLRDQVATPGCYVADAWADLGAPGVTDGTAIVGRLYDGLHPSSLGAYFIGKAVAAILNHLLPPVSVAPVTNSEIRTADNPKGWINSNPMLAGTGGAPAPGTGQLADGWSLRGTAGLTYAFSKVTIAGREWQRVAVTGNTAAGYQEGFIRQVIAANTFVAGSMVQGAGEIEWDQVAGVRRISLAMFNETSYVQIGDMHGNAADALPAAVGGVQMTPALAIDAAGAAAEHRFGISLEFNPSSAVDLVLRIGSAGVRVVN